ncbi:GRAM domain-containing protein 2B-like isoform X2 [Tigriopus californicus]|uniref:GRAM domain-containing protein 2B-like isoform X2 n=1 Tax=Tigriopus californicus TaxID=6832 RepID=UPI0027D9CEEF|nr:GRAM domain-containing protein 2B-like isoform X2 [Tigriopus californicus]
MAVLKRSVSHNESHFPPTCPKSAPSSPKATRSTRTFTDSSVHHKASKATIRDLSQLPNVGAGLGLAFGGGGGGGGGGAGAGCVGGGGSGTNGGNGGGALNNNGNTSSENERPNERSSKPSFMGSAMVSNSANGNATTATTLSNSQSPLNSQNNLYHNHNNLSIGNLGALKEKEVIQGKISSQPSHDSDSDYGPPAIPPSTSNNRSRQKKFMKTFSQLPQEEVVLQRYSCALVADILLQGHLYITENYFAFYSNVFGYITKLQIPIRSVIRISKEKTARIIPNAVGLTTNEEKHVFSSLLSRDSTFKFLTHVWKRALRDQVLREAQDLEDVADSPENPLETELDDEVAIQHSSESDGHTEDTHVPSPCDTVDSALESSYMVKRMSLGTSGNLTPTPIPTRFTPRASHAQLDHVPKDDSKTSFEWKHYCQTTYLTTALVVTLLLFLFCSSLYLVYRVHELQLQVESHLNEKPKPTLPNWLSYFDLGESEELKKILTSNVDQIAEVRKNLEKLSDIINKGLISTSDLNEVTE